MLFASGDPPPLLLEQTRRAIRPDLSGTRVARRVAIRYNDAARRVYRRGGALSEQTPA